MRAKRFGRSLLMTAVVVALVAVVTGCGGSNPPCETDIAAVDAARKTAADAEARLAELQRQTQQLEESIAAEQARQDALASQKAELEAKIAEKAK